jgi:hypothetical protein
MHTHTREHTKCSTRKCRGSPVLLKFSAFAHMSLMSSCASPIVEYLCPSSTHVALTGHSQGTHRVLTGYFGVLTGSSRVRTGYSGDSARHSSRDGRAGIRAPRSAGRRCEHCAARLKGRTVSTRYALTWNTWGTHGVLKGTQGVLKGYSSGTQAALKRHSRGAQGAHRDAASVARIVCRSIGESTTAAYLRRANRFIATPILHTGVLLPRLSMPV